MVSFQLTDYFSIRHLLYWRWRLWRSQYASEEHQKALQWKMLSQMLDHCFQNVPYYREQLRKSGLRREDFKSIDDLSKLPVLQKTDVFDHPKTFKSDNFRIYKPKPVRTTGTTGSPMQVYWDRSSNIMELVCNWRHFSWFGYRIGMPFLDIRNYSQYMTGKVTWNWKCRGLETSIAFWNTSNIMELVRFLRKYHIRFWRGHPTAIYRLCQYCEEVGIHDAKPQIVITTGEALLAYQQNYIEKWLGNAVGDSYGLTEHTALICKCPEGRYHIASEYGVVEIIKPDGSPAKPGEEGKIISTGLHNWAFPLLRYDTGDLAVAADESCSCGRTLPVVQEIIGRITDTVFDSQGRHVSGLHRSFKYAEGIRYSQIVQNSLGTLDVYIIPTEHYSSTTQDQILARLHMELGKDMNIRFHLVDVLPFPSSRKFKFTVNRIKKQV